MKKILTITAALGLCAVSAFSQGTILFNNSATTLVITNGPAGNANSSVRVELLYQPGSGSAPGAYMSSGIVSSNGWEATTTPFQAIAANGRFVGGNETTGSDIQNNGNVWLTVVGWTGGFTSLQAAIAGGAQVGESSIWEQATGGSGSPPATAVSILVAPTAGNAFAGVTLAPITGTPEPTTLALGGLGAAALLFLRRKK